MSAPPTFPEVTRGDWRRRVAEELGGGDPERELSFELFDGMTVVPLYTDRPQLARLVPSRTPNSLGWHLCARYDAGGPRSAARRIAADLDGGATALWLSLEAAARAPAKPTQQELRPGGLALDSTADFDKALAGVHLDALPLLVDAGANAVPALLGLLAVANGRGLGAEPLEWHLGMDPLAALARDGALPGGAGGLTAEMASLVRFCDDSMPRGTALGVSDLPYHSAGANSADELGIAAATILYYLRSLEDLGVQPEHTARRTMLRVAVGRDLFASIAKLRAARLLWSKIARGVGVDEAPAAVIHAVGSDRPLTVRDPWVNMLRTTGMGVAAALGGADFVTLPSFDRTLGAPSDAGRRLARNTQSILGEESALGRVADPAGGSYYLEHLTDSLARRAWRTMQAIERQGGMLEALECGWLQERLASRWAARTSEIAHRRMAITGVSEYANLDERLPATGANEPIERADTPRADPPGGLGPLSLDPRSAWIEWAEAGATIADLSSALGRQPGPAIEPLPRHRDAEAFEALRDAAAERADPLTVHLETLGTLREHKARATFAANLFAAGGIAVAEGSSFVESGASIACLCGSDEAYQAEGAERVRALREAGAGTIFVAGRRERLGDPAAVDGEIYSGCDALAILGALLR